MTLVYSNWLQVIFVDLLICGFVDLLIFHFSLFIFHYSFFIAYFCNQMKGTSVKLLHDA